MSEVKWFKITSNVFDDQKIRAMELMPDGDTIIVIWFKMIALAAQSNQNGVVMFTENIPYTEDLLISYLGKKDTTTRLALETFKMWGMLELTDEESLVIKNFNKYQNVKGLDDIREQNRLRQQNYRDKQKILLLKDNKTNKEDNKIIDIRENNVKRNVTIPYTIILEFLNDKANKNFRIIQTHKDKIKPRWNDGFTLEEFKKVILIKCAEWLNTEQDKYLRPETLFSNKFDGYLNQKEITTAKGKHLLPTDINSDWLDDYIKNIK